MVGKGGQKALVSVGLSRVYKARVLMEMGCVSMIDDGLGLMTIKEVMVYLKIRESKVRKMILNKEIKYIKIGNLIRFRRIDIEKYIDENSIKPRLINFQAEKDLLI